MFWKTSFRILILSALAAQLAGCGGGGSAGGAIATGRVGVHISWPGRSRYVPPYANSVVCQLQVNGGPTYSMTMNRSGDQASEADAVFPQEVPAGTQTLNVTAYSQINGQGVNVAGASMSVIVTPGRTATSDVTGDLQSTIDHLVIDGQPLSVTTSSTLQINGHAEDGTGHVILLPSGSLTWDVSAGGQYGSINSTTGLFTASAAGTATVRLKEAGAQKSVTANVAVTDLASNGSLTVTVDWPGRSRYVPPYANSLVCLLTISSSETHSITINRTGDTQSTGSASFGQAFPPGSYSLAVTAYSQANGGGSAIASATVTVALTSGQATTRNVSADLQSTIDHLVIDGQPLSVATPNTLQISGHAENASNQTILLPQGALTWDIPIGASYGNINTTTGLFTAVSAGTATVRLREIGAAKSVTASVSVTGTASSQKVYVADAGNLRIVRMDAFSGTGWTTLATGSTAVSSVAVDSSGRVYWADPINNQICCASSFTGSITRYGSTGSSTGQFDGPVAVAVDAQQRIYVVDQYNNRVVRMDNMSGANWTEVGGFGADDGQLYVPQGIFVASNGDTYVADTGNCRIVMFNNMASSGWTTFGGLRGSDVGQFDTPTSVWVASSGIYVADSMNNRIAQFTDMTGSGWTTIGSAGSGSLQFNAPYSVSVDSTGRIYVADQGNDRIVKFDTMTGTNWITFGSTGSGTNQFSGPAGMLLN